MLEARRFTILTDDKLVNFAFHHKRDKCSPRQFNHLDYASQFTTVIHHISGQSNFVADSLSPDEVITAPVTHEALAGAQENDDELRTTLVSTTALQLERTLTPAPQSSCTATPLLVNIARTSHPLSAVRS